MGLFKRLFGSDETQASNYHEPEPEREHYGIAESELDEIARGTSQGLGASIGEDGIIHYLYTSRSGKSRFHTDLVEDEYGDVHRPEIGYWPGQWRDSADEFADRVNERVRAYGEELLEGVDD